MNKKALHLYDELKRAELRLAVIRDMLLNGRVIPENAAFSIRQISIELAELAVSVFREASR